MDILVTLTMVANLLMPSYQTAQESPMCQLDNACKLRNVQTNSIMHKVLTEKTNEANK